MEDHAERLLEALAPLLVETLEQSATRDCVKSVIAQLIQGICE